jgi:hypothetical protein
MPKALDDCVKSLMAQWSKDPKSRPTPKKDKDGKPQDAKTQAHAICTASLKKSGKMEEELTEIMLEGNGMTLMGVAVTNRPHLKGLPPVKVVRRIVGEEEKDLLRIPLLLQGIFKHPKGNLVFNPKVFERLKRNLRDNVIEQDLCVDSRHNPDWGALGWVGPGFPGTGLQEEDDILVAYADPTPIGREKVEQNLFRYASAELHANFRHPQIGDKFEAAKLSTDEIDVVLLEHIAEEEARIMAEKDKDTIIDEPQNDEAMQVKLEEERQKREELETRLEELEKQQQEREKDLITRLEEAEIRLAEKDREGYEAHVEAVMIKAESYRDKDGKGHPKLLLEAIKAALLLEDFKFGDEDKEIITLEHEEDKEPTVAHLQKYYHDLFIYLLENLPGLVPTQGGTKPDDTPPGATRKLEEGEPSSEEIRDFWGIEPEKEED